MKTTDFYSLIPSYVRGLVSENIISKAINYHSEMVNKYPDKEVLYFIGKENAPDNVFILQEIASCLFYQYCHKFNAYGCNEIYDVLKCKKIPSTVVRFYVEQKQGGKTELEIIANVYKISNKFTEKELMQIEYYNKQHPEHIEQNSDFLKEILNTKNTPVNPKKFISAFDFLELVAYQNNLSLKLPEENYAAKSILHNSITLN